MWFEGYWWWVCPSGQPTSAQKFALWNVTAQGLGTLIPGRVVTSGGLTAGQWNWIPLSAPFRSPWTCSTPALDSPETPRSNDQFDPGDPYAAGIVNGPLTAYSDSNGSLPTPYTTNQGVFGTQGTDPSVHMPLSGSNSANFWVDLQVGDTLRRGAAALTASGRTSTTPHPKPRPTPPSTT